MTKKYGRSYYNNFPISRFREDELTTAIEELERRGYELVKRGTNESEQKQFDYREKKGQKLSYTGREVHQKHWAIMRKVADSIG